MADVRELLRAERASRRLTHPHASYTKEGKLLCNLCEVPIKSEGQWQSHLHSTQHLLRSQRAKEAEDVRSTGTKKRKAESPTLDAEVDERKRIRANEDETDAIANGDEERRSKKMARAERISTIPKTSPALSTSAEQQQADIDEAELAAFEQELADLEKDSLQAQLLRTNSAAVNAAATISAAPISAEELAAQASAEQSTQRGRRDAELEAEKEDAARVLEDELEEMQELEDRVRKLREQREALRYTTERGDAANGTSDGIDESIAREASASHTNDKGEDIDENDDDDEEYDDVWRFGTS